MVSYVMVNVRISFVNVRSRFQEFLWAKSSAQRGLNSWPAGRWLSFLIEIRATLT